MTKILPIYPISNRIKSRYLRDNLDIEIIPFVDCNLACDFCEVRSLDQKKKNFHVYSECFERLINVIRRKPKFKSMSVHLSGGELFQDKFKTCDDVIQFVDNLISLSKKLNVLLKIVVTTNLVHHNVDAIKELAKRNVVVNTSYDFVGRFTKDGQIRLWWENIEKLYKDGICPQITTIAHKQNIDQILEKNPTFDRLCEYNVSFEKYVDANNIQKYVIDDRQLAHFYRYLFYNYPNVHPICDYLVSDSQSINVCSMQTLDILPNQTNWECCDKQKAFIDLVKIKGCVTCEYNNYCCISCPNEMDKSSFCIHKEMYKLCHNI